MRVSRTATPRIRWIPAWPHPIWGLGAAAAMRLEDDPLWDLGPEVVWLVIDYLVSV